MRAREDGWTVDHEDPRMKYVPPKESILTLARRYYFQDNLDRNMGVLLRAVQLDFANSEFRELSKQPSGDVTFADVLAYRTPLCAD